MEAKDDEACMNKYFYQKEPSIRSNKMNLHVYDVMNHLHYYTLNSIRFVYRTI
jgi:hypothetical protein